ncbi:Ca2+-transporting ATPase [Duganella sp. CF402]|uniref:cation-translocating P-type ATPase n=1 Tax=unclassified Duganella TaxID=2636909 RepID=UPI0008BD3A1C|nr:MULTISPECIES: cation-translocating P-type ATPase [unclassified Duganella]RZT11043.1 Ca2+-transporting ATPase [Duganella sp. BK701]SEK84236.1 Ca2+-transporting ATPase [Duganella sp. CF402]
MDGARTRWLAIVARTVCEPMTGLLLLACGIYLALGELHEGLLLAFMVCMTVGLTLQQQLKSDRALQALRELSSPQVLVWRDGRAVRIDSRALRVGDLLMVAEGERIAADAVLERSQNLRVDESLLTGESAPVAKAPAGVDLPPAAPGGDGLPYLWSGTLVVEGEGLARVTATGGDTELGKVGRSLAELEPGDTPLQRGIAGTVRLLAVVALATSVLVTLLHGLAHGAWLAALLSGIAVSMALLPEELPVIMTVFPVIGAWRLARGQVLTRRLAALEALGCISVLCVDKTGTLTCNRMQVAELHADGAALRLDAQPGALAAPFAQLVRMASLASKRRAYDPMEMAFHQLAGGAPDAEPVREYPLSAELRAMSQVWPVSPANAGAAMTVAAKGAPEAIAGLCRMSAAERASMAQAMEAMATRGLRVLAVAQARHAGGVLPATQDGFDFQYLGLVGLSDPLRPEVGSAVQACAGAGVRVLMITGDYPATARSIAAQAGIPTDAVLCGDELDQLDAAALRRRLAVASICARIRPTQKLRIVQALQAGGAVVGMTGDGVNDAPALKAADVGIAMGGRGSEVAREAAALVLLDDNFASIVNGIRLGRRIFGNMRHAMSYVLAMHVPIAGMALLPVLLDWPGLLYPVHIALLELIIDPACALAFENQAAAPEQMQRPPRRPEEPLLERRTVAAALVQGVLVLLVVAGAYGAALAALPAPAARAVGYAVLVLANVGLIFSNLAYRRSLVQAVGAANRTFWLVAAAALALLAVVLFVPGVTSAFQVAPLSWGQLLVVAGIGLGSMALSALVRLAAIRHGAN